MSSPRPISFSMRAEMRSKSTPELEYLCWPWDLYTIAESASEDSPPSDPDSSESPCDPVKSVGKANIICCACQSPGVDTNLRPWAGQTALVAP